jgi:hypothetical protein
VGIAAVVTSGITAASPADGAKSPEGSQSSTGGSVVPQRLRNAVLGKDWKTSNDRIVFGQGDPSGFHVFTATERTGYEWKTLTTLVEPGIETDRWIGNTCVTGDGKHVAVVYGPRTFTNEADMMERGGFSAVIDLASGKVTKLPFGSTLAYFNPGCGAGRSAAFTTLKGADEAGTEGARTQIQTVDASTGKSLATVVEGTLTSAIPTSQGIVGAAGNDLVRVTPTGHLVKLAAANSAPYNLVPLGSTGLTYMDKHGATSTMTRVDLASAKARPQKLANGRATDMVVVPVPGTRALLLGQPMETKQLPDSVRKLASPRVRTASTEAHALLISDSFPSAYSSKDDRTPSAEWASAMTLEPTGDPDGLVVSGTLYATASGKRLPFSIIPGQGLVDGKATGRRPVAQASSANTGDPKKERRLSVQVAAVTTSTSTIDTAAYCAIPRNDPRTQVYQPTPRQVEWAADEAVAGNLTISRPANWKQAHMTAAWTPQGLFPSIPLSGGGRVPAQVLLGVLAQESNLWQASGHSLSGVPGNPLIGNYYGRPIYNDIVSDDFDITWEDSDCGYGVSQITDGMRKAGHLRTGEVALSAAKQRAVAVDYATNIAAGLTVLQKKWNETRAAGLIQDTGTPDALENWIFAIWAYNSGLHAKSGSAPWGLGWQNNPINPIYNPARLPFGKDPADAANPQRWPYQEKVIGFAAYSIATLDGPGFYPAWWITAADRDKAQSPVDTFCTAANSCYPGQLHTPNSPEVIGAPAGPCAHVNSAGQYDLQCWWHEPIAYRWCAGGYCGHETLRFNSTYPEQPDGANNPPNCSRTGLPSGALVIDDVATSAPPISTTARPCGTFGSNAGALTFAFPEYASGKSQARVDFHQSGAGFGGHLWFAHTRPSSIPNFKVTGTWTFTNSLTKWCRVMVHIPDYAAQTQQAAYIIDNGAGVKETRYALQRTRTNGWVSLGVIKFNGRPKISLSSQTFDGTGSDDIAWDAVAIQPLSAKPASFVVALGDSYTSGEGASVTTVSGDTTNHGADYYPESDFGGDLSDDAGRNACHRSKMSWPRKAILTGNTSPLGVRSDAWDPTLDFQFHACSGAKTNNLNEQHSGTTGGSTNPLGEFPTGLYGEVSQIDKGYLDANTTLVMLSIGGNDARFRDIITKCITDLTGVCQNDSIDNDSSPLSEAEPALINGGVKAALTQTLQQIHQHAPNARILLMGYPKLLEADGACIPGLGTEETPWLNDLTLNVMRPMEQAVATSLTASGTQVMFGDPAADFEGKGICGNPEHIRGIVEDTTYGDRPKTLGLYPPSNQSFHPNTDGTTDYASTAKRILHAMGL